MPPLIRLYRNGKLIRKLTGAAGDNLLQCITHAGIFVDSPCGGSGKCAKCLVRLDADGEQVLACRTIIDGDMAVYLPDVTDMAVTDGTAVYQHVETSEPRLGVALDVGTTTVVAHLVDLDTGSILATASGVNAQRSFGADVISRIQYCAGNGHNILTGLIREQLDRLVAQTCASSGASAADIEYVCIAANTIMQHIAAGLSPVGMGTVPFAPISLFGSELPAWDSPVIPENAIIYFTPAISSYVGGDITAGILAAGLDDMQGPVLFIDIGTNGEMVLKADNTYFCCATAAGPAFEGAEISQGMAAVNGAISHVRYTDTLELDIIGSSTALGLCGSGLLDALAVLIRTGAVDETGRMPDAQDINHDIAQNICTVNGSNALCLTQAGGGVYITASDVRKLQLAKSAIASGIQTLLHHTGVKTEEIKSFILAGGFGSFLDAQSAAAIGLFPKSLLPVTTTPGNTAGRGAVMAVCSGNARAKLERIRERCEYIELSSSHVFNEQFIEQMTFETD